jgi:hypothetical protein
MSSPVILSIISATVSGEGLGGLRKRVLAKLRADTLEVGCLAGIGEESEVTDLHESGGQDVQQESANELLAIEAHLLAAVVVAAVAVAEAYAAVSDGQDAMVGDGDSVGVAAEVVEHLLGADEGALGIDDPGLVSESVHEAGELLGGSQGGRGAGEQERVLMVAAFQKIQIPGAEGFGE